MTGRETALARARVLKGALLDFGVPGVSIELQEGRPTYGADPWNACKPVGPLSHHIASHPTPENPCPGLALVKQGRDDLDGPLANGHAGVDLVYRILTLGYANHPGEGGPLTLSGPLGTYIVPLDVGRPYLWGTEYEGGYSEAVWDRVYTHRASGVSMTFREFMGRANAGLAYGIWLINGHGRTPRRDMDLSGYHGEHKTWAPGRKPDRLNYTTESGRAEIRRYQKDDDMPSPADLWNHEIRTAADDGETTLPAKTMLAQAHHRAEGARENAASAGKIAQAALDQSKRNRDAIKALGQQLDGLAPGLASAVTAALGDAVEVEVTVTVPNDNPPA